MNGNCTCGVELVEGARFCHKCGRPVDGFEIAEEIAPPPVVERPLLIPPPLPSTPVGFRNRDTVRAALLSAAITFFPASAAGQISGALILAGLLINGLLSVLLYLRRTGRGMSTIEGARQGWISGLFFFSMSFVISALVIALSGKGFFDLLQEQAKAQGTAQADLAKVFEQPAMFTVFMIAAFLVALILVTTLGSLGGILGARLFGNNDKNARQETGL